MLSRPHAGLSECAGIGPGEDALAHSPEPYFRACAYWRVTCASRISQKAAQSLRRMPCARSCLPNSAASYSWRPGCRSVILMVARPPKGSRPCSGFRRLTLPPRPSALRDATIRKRWRVASSPLPLLPDRHSMRPGLFRHAVGPRSLPESSWHRTSSGRSGGL